MAIKIYIGNVGSGKTLSAVRQMYFDPRRVRTYSNIRTRGIPQNNLIKPEMIVEKYVKDVKKNKKTGEETPVYDWKLNLEFWKRQPKPLNVTIDEAHNILNSRRAMSKTNILVTDWLAMLRRVVGSVDSTAGELIFITQLINRIDNIARDMATQIRFHRCHFRKTCMTCGLSWPEVNDNPEPRETCPRCGNFNLKKHNHMIEVFHFQDLQSYQGYNMFGMRSYHRHYYIRDAEQIFQLYDTLQWDNMFENLY